MTGNKEKTVFTFFSIHAAYVCYRLEKSSENKTIHL